MKKFLIAGLGNIGEDYIDTRHNIGFKILDYIAKKEGFSFHLDTLGYIASHSIKGKSVLFLKPSTYMNRSGKAIKYWLDKKKVSIANLLVITDDLYLPFGTIRVKGKGSDGGHNGLKDIQQYIGSQYCRYRFGIGSTFPKGRQSDYVLEKWNLEEQNQLLERLPISCELVKSFVFAGLSNTMNNFNGK